MVFDRLGLSVQLFSNWKAAPSVLKNNKQAASGGSVLCGLGARVPAEQAQKLTNEGASGILSADNSWQASQQYLQRFFRCVASDRRSVGRSKDV